MRVSLSAGAGVRLPPCVADMGTHVVRPYVRQLWGQLSTLVNRLRSAPHGCLVNLIEVGELVGSGFGRWEKTLPSEQARGSAELSLVGCCSGAFVSGFGALEDAPDVHLGAALGLSGLSGSRCRSGSGCQFSVLEAFR